MPIKKIAKELGISIQTSFDWRHKILSPLSQFIPKQLTEDELRAIIVEMDASHLGEIMQKLKANYDGIYDGKLASTIARDILA